MYEKMGNGGSLFLCVFLLAGQAEAAGKRKIAIDPGHQGSWVDMSAQEAMAPGSSETKAKATTGTEGRFSGVPEYELNLRIALALKSELISRGYEVVMTREDNDTAISNQERAQLANDSGAEACIRIHANGSDDSSGVWGSCHGALRSRIPMWEISRQRAYGFPSACWILTVNGQGFPTTALFMQTI
ncbi:MAG: N-acetylmuramoyl-L-alanine amidase [Lachnospiraceae bacterium]